MGSSPQSRLPWDSSSTTRRKDTEQRHHERAKARRGRRAFANWILFAIAIRTCRDLRTGQTGRTCQASRTSPLQMRLARGQTNQSRDRRCFWPSCWSRYGHGRRCPGQPDCCDQGDSGCLTAIRRCIQNRPRSHLRHGRSRTRGWMSGWTTKRCAPRLSYPAIHPYSARRAASSQSKRSCHYSNQCSSFRWASVSMFCSNLACWNYDSDHYVRCYSCRLQT